MVGFLRNQLHKLSQRELVCICELYPDQVRVSLLARANTNTFEVLENESAPVAAGGPLSALTQVLRSLKPPERAQIIIALDSRYGASARSLVQMARVQPSQALTQAELENLLSRALWKLFNTVRAEAAARLNSDAAKISLADAEAFGMTLDGHRVSDPVGFSPKSVEFDVSVTVAPRELIDSLLTLLPQERVSLIIEAGMAGALCLSRALPSDRSFLYVSIGTDATTIYRCQNGSCGFVDWLKWGSDDIVAAVRKAFAVSPEEAARLISVFESGQAGAVVLKHIKAVLSSELATPLKAIELALEHSTKESVYVGSYTSLPATAQSPALRRQLKIKSPITFLPDDLVSQKSGYTVQLSDDTATTEPWASRLCFLALASASATPQWVHKEAKRRARWLSASQ